MKISVRRKEKYPPGLNVFFSASLARWCSTDSNHWMALSTKRSAPPPPAFYLFLSSVIISAHKMDDSFWKYQGASRLWGVHAVPFMFHLFWCLSSRRGRAESCLQQHKQPINAADCYWIKANNPTIVWQHPAVEIRNNYLGLSLCHIIDFHKPEFQQQRGPFNSHLN